MACNCGKSSTSHWVWTSTSGVETVYATQTEARMNAARFGGSIKELAKV